MKYQVDQPAVLLDTEIKPTVNAVIKEVHPETTAYLAEYEFSNQRESATIRVLRERINTVLNFTGNSN